MKTKWLVETEATAAIREWWIVEAETQAEAEERYGHGLFVADKTAPDGEEQDRKIVRIDTVSDEQAAIEAQHMLYTPLMAGELLAALEDLVAGNYGQPHGVTVPALDRARLVIAQAKGLDA
jgi:formylmethanofuran dehydrogenase subunit B